MLAPVSHILPLTTIRRERLLPIPGKVLVRKGQKVKAMDVVAEANLAPEHIILAVASGLGVSHEEADQLIEYRSGDPIVEGDVIAQRGGLARRVVRAPASGRVVMVGEGQMLIEVESRLAQLVASIPGNVTQVLQERGAVIETTGALIQGVWGNGRIDFGLLSVVADAPESTLAPEQMDVRMRGSVVMAGHCADEESLTAAADLTLRGLILSSMPARFLPAARRLRFPVTLIEGFGNRPYSPGTYQLMATNNGRETVVNAQPYDRYSGTRPEVVIPLPATGLPSLPQDSVELTKGKKVRIVRAPHAGGVGIVGTIRSGVKVFHSGVRAPAVLVNLENGETVEVPAANLEILE